MSKSLKEFLAENAVEIRSEREARRSEISEWATAVSHLIAQIEAWLKDSDSEGILDTRPQSIELAEDRFGRYPMPSLDIWMGGRRATIMPVALVVLGPMEKPGDGNWRGRVDIEGPSDAFSLFRFVHSDGRQEWLIRDERDYRLLPFDRKTFESALVRLLS